MERGCIDISAVEQSRNGSKSPVNQRLLQHRSTPGPDSWPRNDRVPAAGVTPMRYSELAANGISRRLGEPAIFDHWSVQRLRRMGHIPNGKNGTTRFQRWNSVLRRLRAN